MKCACLCGREATGKSKYHHPPTCRPRAHKLRLALDGLTPVERKRLLDREAKRAARSRGRVASDDRVSFERAVEVVAEWLEVSGRVDPNVAEDEARVVLSRARPRSRA